MPRHIKCAAAQNYAAERCGGMHNAAAKKRKIKDATKHHDHHTAKATKAKQVDCFFSLPRHNTP